LFAGTYNYHDGCELWVSGNGEEWINIAKEGFGEGKDNESIIYGLKGYGDKLYISVRNVSKGAEIFSLAD